MERIALRPCQDVPGTKGKIAKKVNLTLSWLRYVRAKSDLQMHAAAGRPVRTFYDGSACHRWHNDHPKHYGKSIELAPAGCA